VAIHIFPFQGIRMNDLVTSYEEFDPDEIILYKYRMRLHNK